MSDHRLPAIAAALILIAPAVYFAPIPSALAIVGAAIVTWQAFELRKRPVLDAAVKLAHAFTFTSESCKPELQALARAVFLWNREATSG